MMAKRNRAHRSELRTEIKKLHQKLPRLLKLLKKKHQQRNQKLKSLKKKHLKKKKQKKKTNRIGGLWTTNQTDIFL